MRLASLYVFYVSLFFSYGFSAFVPKYFGQIGLSDAQIGVLMSLPSLVALFFQPLVGLTADRVRQKRWFLGAAALLSALMCFLTEGQTRFLPLLFCVTLLTIAQLPLSPVSTTIAMEYLQERNRPYGPLRLSGTLGYQAGALILGVLLVGSLKGVYAWTGAVLLFCAAVTCFMPPVEGHQKGQKPISMLRLFAEPELRLLFGMLLVGASTQQFYLSFFTKRLGDLGMDNALAGGITVLSVMYELPMLIFGDRLARKTSIWNWLLIGFFLNGLRWVGLAFAESPLAIVLCQIPSGVYMACFEFFPVLYLNARVGGELKATAQTALILIVFGLSKLIGGLLGGLLCDRVGIPATYLACGVTLFVAVAVFAYPTRKYHRATLTHTGGIA